LTDQLPTIDEIDTVLASIDALIGISAALPQNRAEFLKFEEADSSRYDELWDEIDNSLASFRAAGFWIRNPNKHKCLKHMRGFLKQSPGKIAEQGQVPRENLR